MPRILLYTAILTFATWSADAAEVRLKSEATCSGAVVRLKDVAEIVSGNEGEAAALAELQLFPVPSAGKPRLVRKGEIRELLALSEVNLKAVTLSGAEKMVIRREGVRSVARPQAAGAVVASALITPSTKVSSQPSESTGVELIPVAVRPLERGAILRSTDMELRTASPSLGRGQPALKIADLVGKELMRPLPAGQPISSDLVQSPRLVHRGDKVTVKALASGVIVTISGKALEEGGSGDNVLVEDSATKEKLVTRVSGYQTVEVLGTGVKAVR